MKPLYCLILSSALLVSCADTSLPRNPFSPENPPAAERPTIRESAILDEPRSFKHVETPSGPRINIIYPGIYQGTQMTRMTRTSPGTTSGFTGTLGDSRFVRGADIIPARTGIHFGFLMAVSGVSFEEVVPITIRLLHPPVTHPGTGQTTTKEEWTAPIAFHTKQGALWGFHHEWEVVPGKWTMQAVYQGKVLAEHVFTVVRL